MGVLARGCVTFDASVNTGDQVFPGGVEVEWVFTDRSGGRSSPPFDAANLGTHVGDEPDAVAANRALLSHALSADCASLITMEQVHGRDVAVVTGPYAPQNPPVRADAVITSTPNLVLVTQVADCVPVLLACPEGMIGAVHSGWRGVVAGVVDCAVDALVEAGAATQTMRAWIGPAICAGCYEVGEQVREQVSAVAPAAFAQTRWGTAAVDVVAGVAEQLTRRGICVETIDGCTYEDDRMFSYRRDGRTGRQAGAIVMRAVSG